VPAEGGTPQPLLPNDSHPQQAPNWSVDGSNIAFGSMLGDRSSMIRILRVNGTGAMYPQMSTVPGSQGLFAPQWSPDGRYIAALTTDSHRLMLFDFKTQTWSELATGILSWPNWSHDGKDLYVLSGIANGPLLKVHIANHKFTQVLDIKNFATAGFYGGALALAPDDSPLLLRDAGTYDVYALDWELP
jgi:eukaryotic-like serine/threonine-protein kinase